MKNKSCILMLILAIVLAITAGCLKDNCEVLETPIEDEFPLGWNASEERPDSIQVFLNGFGSNCGSLPQSVSLLSKFPPVGQQGQFGTCVAWAVGYNGKTALEGTARGLSASQLSQTANQISPKDLFYAIPDDQKGTQEGNCHGTQFYYALDVLQKRGAATLQTVPYSDLGDCSSFKVQQAWTTEAGQHKIKYYRRIAQDVCTIKEQLAANNPVFFGATVGSNFQQLRGSQVFASLPTGNPGGHAMVIAGYDDSKQAFRIVNSWGTGWGDQGYAWVGYNFMVDQFVSDKNLYIAVNEDGTVNPPNVNPSAGGVDLASWVFSDIASPQPGNPTLRTLDFNLYNIGTASAKAADEWAFMYLYYNAYDANDYGILFLDGFNENVLPNTYQYNPQTGMVDFNFDIPSGNSFANRVFGKNSVTRTYTVPPITGFYYLLLIADAYDAIEEKDEFNNLFYTTWQTPKWFSNGYSPLTGENEPEARSDEITRTFLFENTIQPDDATLKKSQFISTVNELYPNAYRPEEIIGFVKKQQQTGELGRLVQAHKLRYPNNKLTQYHPR